VQIGQVMDDVHLIFSAARRRAMRCCREGIVNGLRRGMSNLFSHSISDFGIRNFELFNSIC
jgi:hypothetical protein